MPDWTFFLTSSTSFWALSMSDFQFRACSALSESSRPWILSLRVCWFERSSLSAASTVEYTRLASSTADSRRSRLLETEPPPNALEVRLNAEPPVIAPELSISEPSSVTILTPPMFLLATSIEFTTRVFLLTYLTAVSISGSYSNRS